MVGTVFTSVLGFNYVPPPWQLLRDACAKAYETNDFAKTGCVFLHSRTGSASNRRLVRVCLTGSKFPGWGCDTRLVGQAYSLVDGSSPHLVWDPKKELGLSSLQLQDPKNAGVLRLFAGQIDPADASHFTIDFTYDPRDDSEGAVVPSTQPTPRP
jgi:hypothetical protein